MVELNVSELNETVHEWTETYSLTIYEFYFSCQTQQYTKQLTHISLCITEFIDCTMSQQVPAHEAIIRRYINKPYSIELCLLYGSIYCTDHCVSQ
jgi:hypothetical protein